MKEIDFAKVKYPEYIRDIHFMPTIEQEDLSYRIKMKAQVFAVEKIEEMLVDRISEIAKEHGITDLYILDKQNIVTALQKQIPKKPLPDDRHFGVGRCPSCYATFLDNTTNYCGHCGQKLDWGQEE